MTYRLRNIGIAVALALMAGLLTVFYVTNYKREVRSAEENVAVFVAARDIPAGTTGDEVISGGYLEKQEIAKRAVTPGAISSPDQIAGRIAAAPVYAGEQVTTRRFTTEQEKGIRAQLTGNKRALALPGSEQQLLAGTLQDGDHVDVVGSWNVPEADTNHFARVVLRDIPVLEAPAGNGAAEKLTDPQSGGFTVMLMVTDAQAQKLWWLAQHGTWTLQLRPPTDAADSPESAENAASILMDGVNVSRLRSVTNASNLLLDGGQ
jgi:Flp pilus assembly protein CpaB